MFGLIMPQRESLSPEDAARFEKMYCGLCMALGQECGQCMRLGLTYDMTFLALFLSAFYEEEEEEKLRRCAAHPKKKRPYIKNHAVSYAACMTALLVHHKCMDDWQDDRHIPMRLYAAATNKAFRKAEEMYPDKARRIEEALSRLYAAEKKKESPTHAADAFGAVMGEIFAYKADAWEKPMRQFGMALGQFIYSMDAVLDYEKDKKRGRYNPLLLLEKTPTEMEDTLTFFIGRAAAVFEKMPFVQDIELIRNILYKGVWQKYRLGKRGDR